MCRSTYQFPTGAVTNDHSLSGLEQYILITLIINLSISRAVILLKTLGKQ